MNAPETNLEPATDPSVAAAVSHALHARAPRFLRQAANGVLLALLAFSFYFLISHYLLQSVKIVGSSMAPTLHDSENYLLNRWIYHIRKPQSTDVVVLRDPLDGGFSVKRVVAVAGDTVLIKDGLLFVNGRETRENYLPPMTFTFGEKREEIYKCGSDEYFVLGDNRNNSVDSRRYGPVHRQHILGLIIH